VDLLTIILACSLHPDDQLVEAFIRKVTDANRLFLGDFESLVTHDDLKSPEQVLELAASISEKGGRPALGLMAIPPSWAARFNRTPADLLDACTNVSIGTAMMSSFAAACAPRGDRRIRHNRHDAHARRALAAERFCILESLDRAIGVKGFTNIISEISRLPTRGPDSDSPPERSNFIDGDPPSARPQVPLEVPAPTVSAPGSGATNRPRSDQSRPPEAPNQTGAPDAPRASAPPPNRPAPNARRPGEEAGR
jgi:hypothetical protein